jgi:tetratricopeptide (TPR) repeat protein
MKCEDIARDGLLDKYLDGALDRAQRDAVEFHIRSCVSCMLTSEKMRAERRGPAEAPPPRPSILARLRARAWTAATVVVILAVIGVFFGLARQTIHSRPQPLTITVPATQVPPAREALVQEISQVGFLGYRASTRTLPPLAEKRHQEATQLYNQRLFSQAANAFRDVLAIDPEDSHSRLYMGVCYAATGDLVKAEETLRQVAGKPADPYYNEAKFVLAKVLFGQNRLDEGAELLRSMDAPGNPFGPQSRRLVEIREKLR